jgi:tetratricopeptide (TPR) repeat protein
MPTGLRLTACAAAFLALLTPALAGTVVCDPNAAANDRARSLRIAAQLPQARAATLAVLKTSPDDFRANYTLGLIALDESAHDAKQWQPAMDQLRKAAALLDAHYSTCASLGWYSIYNTLGVEYYRTGHNSDALGFFKRAYAHYGELNVDTRQKLLRNLGNLYFEIGDFKNAQAVSQKAQAEHFPGSAARVNAIAIMQQRALPAGR